MSRWNWVWLVVLPPLGIGMLWVRRARTVRTRVWLTAASLVWFVIALAVSGTSPAKTPAPPTAVASTSSTPASPATVGSNPTVTTAPTSEAVTPTTSPDTSTSGQGAGPLVRAPGEDCKRDQLGEFATEKNGAPLTCAVASDGRLRWKTVS